MISRETSFRSSSFQLSPLKFKIILLLVRQHTYQQFRCGSQQMRNKCIVQNINCSCHFPKTSNVNIIFMQQQVQVKNIVQFASFRSNYIQQIHSCFHNNTHYYASYAQKIPTLGFNSKGLFILSEDSYGNVSVAYSKKVQIKDWLIKEKNLKYKLRIENICKYSITDNNQLNIIYTQTTSNKIETLDFQFPTKQLVNQWLDIIFQYLQKSKKPAIVKDVKKQQAQKREEEDLKEKYNIVCESLKVLGQLSEADRQKVSAIQNKNRQLDDTLSQLRQQNANLKANLQNIETSMKHKNIQCSLLSQSQNSLRQELINCEAHRKIFQEETKANLQLQQLKTRETESKLTIFKENISKLEALNKSLTERGQIFAGQCQALKKENTLEKQEVGKLRKKEEELQQNIKNKIYQMEQLRQHYLDKERLFSQELIQKRKEIARLQIHSVKLQEQKLKLNEQIRLLKVNQLFAGNCLDSYIHFKVLLKDQIEQFRKQNIVGTKLLFKFDSFNKINFHHYIDRKSDIVLVIKTTEGVFLAGYSESPITPENNADRPGFLMSLTYQKVFYLEEGKKAVAYDDYYIIFGNSELRIRNLELTLFSNFGISNAYYQNKGLGVEALLGRNSRQIDIETYEVHQVFLDD